ncbi:MAG: hypothetical protein HRT82_00375 [Henriciella sp.]|nr:hypothetical protein [Henriciella sp.]
MTDRYFAFLVEILSKPGSDLWNDNQQGGFGWFFVRARNEEMARRTLELELEKLGQALKSVDDQFEVLSSEQLELEEHKQLFSLLKSEKWQVQYRTLETYPFNVIE